MTCCFVFLFSSGFIVLLFALVCFLEFVVFDRVCFFCQWALFIYWILLAVSSLVGFIGICLLHVFVLMMFFFYSGLFHRISISVFFFLQSFIIVLKVLIHGFLLFVPLVVWFPGFLNVFKRCVG